MRDLSLASLAPSHVPRQTPFLKNLKVGMQEIWTASEVSELASTSTCSKRELREHKVMHTRYNVECHKSKDERFYKYENAIILKVSFLFLKISMKQFK